ncbi:hypothetical protein [Streptomyces sp. 3N207]|uniref:hypothetical protein n=1 Tax=Streptomyces sp. 3N207 TaxID=3457417 RepID=UPI003FD05E9E
MTDGFRTLSAYCSGDSPLSSTARAASMRAATCLERIRDFRRRVFAEVTAEWTAEGRAAFARLLTRFVRDVDALSAP